MPERMMVCGTRGFTDRAVVFEYLDAFFNDDPPERIIAGGAAGPDTLAIDWAIAAGANHSVYPADWAKEGRAAGVLRNTRMIQEAKPTVVTAFWDGRSRGTLDAITKATLAGIPVHIIPVAAFVSAARG